MRERKRNAARRASRSANRRASQSSITKATTTPAIQKVSDIRLRTSRAECPTVKVARGKNLYSGGAATSVDRSMPFWAAAVNNEPPDTSHRVGARGRRGHARGNWVCWWIAVDDGIHVGRVGMRDRGWRYERSEYSDVSLAGEQSERLRGRRIRAAISGLARLSPGQRAIARFDDDQRAAKRVDGIGGARRATASDRPG